MTRVPLTKTGAERLREELATLKKVDRPRVIAAIAEARAHGDLKENAEYHAAREQQGFIEGRIQLLESTISHAQIIDIERLNPGERVVFGATVSLADEETGEERIEQRLKVDALVERIVRLIITREKNENKRFGVVVLAEGLAERFPEAYIRDVPKDPHGHLSIGRIDIGRLVAKMVGDEYGKQTGKKRKITGLQLGYESRCCPPHAFDVMLGSQLGIGGFRGLVEEGLDGHMVSVSGQLDLHYVEFHKLVNPETLRTEIRFIHKDSDFYRLARFLETRTEQIER